MAATAILGAIFEIRLARRWRWRYGNADGGKEVTEMVVMEDRRRGPRWTWRKRWDIQTAASEVQQAKEALAADGGNGNGMLDREAMEGQQRR